MAFAIIYIPIKNYRTLQVFKGLIAILQMPQTWHFRDFRDFIFEDNCSDFANDYVCSKMYIS